MKIFKVTLNTSVIKLPRDIEDAKNLGRVLSHYKERYYQQVILAIFVIYILYPFKNEQFFFF